MTSHVRTITRSEFKQDSSAAERGAIDGPVYITDRGVPSHVLLSYEQYQQLAFEEGTLADLLGRTPGVAEVEFELPDRGEMPPPIDLD